MTSLAPAFPNRPSTAKLFLQMVFRISTSQHFLFLYSPSEIIVVGIENLVENYRLNRFFGYSALQITTNRRERTPNCHLSWSPLVRKVDPVGEAALPLLRW